MMVPYDTIRIVLYDVAKDRKPFGSKMKIRIRKPFETKDTKTFFGDRIDPKPIIKMM
jgi:hypothetical protein